MTKRVEYCVDLAPGWQDWNNFSPSFNYIPYLPDLTKGHRRVKIVVDLPCFGGSADVTETVTAKVETDQ